MIRYLSLSYPANKSRPHFKEKLEIKLPTSWIKLVSHEKVINDISCCKENKPLIRIIIVDKRLTDGLQFYTPTL